MSHFSQDIVPKNRTSGSGFGYLDPDQLSTLIGYTDPVFLQSMDLGQVKDPDPKYFSSADPQGGQ